MEDLDDAALARALQEEYEREYRGDDEPIAWPQHSTYEYPSAPTVSQVFDRSSLYNNDSNNIRLFDEIGDDSFVRPSPTVPSIVPTLILGQQQAPPSREAAMYESSYRDETPPLSELDIVRPKSSRYSITTTPNDLHHDIEMSEDEVLARRLEQELHDEEYAREIIALERASRHHVTTHSIPNDITTTPHHSNVTAHRFPNDTMEPKRCCGCTLCMCSSFVVSLVFFAIAAVVILNLLGSTDDGTDSKPAFPTYDDFRKSDPFNSTNPADANPWRTNGAGLTLTMINALDEKWHENFFRAVDEWDAGTPDALSLTTEISQPDSECKAVNGRVKVCNGNYGATSWRGINKVLLKYGRIYSSAARMNDFYVQDDDIAQKQYTMCHEIGHAFGLPHTDEDFFNKDLLNCMDYTSRPENNMQPSTTNFEFLVSLYGTIPASGNTTGAIPAGGNTTGTIPVGGNTTGTIPAGENTTATTAEAAEPHETSNNNNDRLLFGKDLPVEIEIVLDEIDAIADSGMFDGSSSRQGWRQLHFSEHGQAHEIDMGNGYAVQLHMLGV